MGRDIANMAPASGQMLKDDNNIVNIAEKIEAMETAAGTNGTGITPSTGGTGILGWLSGIYNLLFGGTAKVQLSGSNVAEATVLNVTLAGTRQQLPDIDCSQVMIIAKRGNKGYIYVGGDDVSLSVYGIELGELDCVVLPVSNTNQIYIDASISGEGISYVAI